MFQTPPKLNANVPIRAGLVCRMGYDVKVVAELHSSPKAHALDVLSSQFEALDHAPGSKIVKITEHVAIADEADAIAFARMLVADALPEGSKIIEVSATAD